MKKLIVILALVMVACVPAMAAVTVSCAQVGTTKDCEVRYTVTGPNSVRAFALDVSLGGGKTISSVTCSSTDYDTYPGSIQISGGSVTDAGTCVCDASKYPGVTQPGIGSSAMTVEMGSLYASGEAKPATSGVLFKFTASDYCTVTLAQNTSRGGVVMENPDENPGLTLTGCTLSAPSTDCFPSNYVGYSDWKSLGKPNCWCGTAGTPQWKYQCDGDGDNATETLSKFRVYTNDYKCVISNWKKKTSDLVGQPGACCDYDHKTETLSKFRVYTNDYKRVLSNWKKKDTALPGNCPRNE